MKAVTVRPELETFAGEPVNWSYAARVVAPVSVEALIWARATFQHASVVMRAFLVAGWTLLLLEGRPYSDPTHILGWPVAHTTPSRTVLKRRSRLGIHATLVFTTLADTVTFSSGMAYSNRFGRIVWSGVAPIHRWAVRTVLTHAATDIGRSGDGEKRSSEEHI